jgi:hypothetical protein
MFEFVNDTLVVEAKSLYEDNGLGLISYDNYKKLCSRGKLNKVVPGGNGRKAMIDYSSMPDELRARIKKLCDGKSPYELERKNKLKTIIENDLNAYRFYQEFRKPDGDTLSIEKIHEYTANAKVLNAIGEFIKNKNAWKKTMGGRKTNMWEEVSNMVNEINGEEIPHSLPQKPRPLRNKYKRYVDEGYGALVHGGTGNTNTEKLSDIAKAWVLAKWATNIERLTIKQLWQAYNDVAEENGWKQLTSEKTIRNYLYQPEIQEQWYGHRHGELKAKEKYGYQQSTTLPSMRDSLWYSDGTKVNLYYLDEDGKVQTTSVYEVMDTYSEVFLGYHISKTEDFEAQFRAFKMAVQFAGHKPYEARYDNQGGHKKLQNGDFLNKLSHLSIRTQPYNGKSKTIESAFGRFQQQFLHKKWYFTGQNITAKKVESKANMEFIAANKVNLPTLDEAISEYVKLREEWNNAPHPATGKSRIEMYQESFNPKSPSISFLEMVDLFWILREKPVMYTAYGLTIQHKNRKYTFTKYHEPLKPDIKWHRENIDRKFYVKYDPEDMTSICIYKKTHAGLQYVAQLDEKVEVHRGKQEADEWEASFLAQVNEANKTARLETRDKTEKVLEEFGVSAEQNGLITPPIKGLETLKSKKGQSSRKVKAGEIGKVEKDLSNVVPDVDDEDFENYFYNKL